MRPPKSVTELLCSEFPRPPPAYLGSATVIARLAGERLLSRHKLTGDLLTDRNQRLAEAYAQQERKLG